VDVLNTQKVYHVKTVLAESIIALLLEHLLLLLLL
jgi:hypothetical protein